MTLYLKIDDNKIKDIKFQTFGCGSAIAVSSMLTEIAMGSSLDDARKITNKDVVNALEGLPKNKLHCSNLGAEALHLAIKNYEERKLGKVRTEVKLENKITECTKDKTCFCPYCDSKIGETDTFCKACQSELTEEH
jgi:nitrogen fixation NifU-like protein